MRESCKVVGFPLQGLGNARCIEPLESGRSPVSRAQTADDFLGDDPGVKDEGYPLLHYFLLGQYLFDEDMSMREVLLLEDGLKQVQQKLP